MSIGYACLTIGVKNTDFKSCRLKNATEDKLLEIIAHNLNSLENIIDYNIKNNIRLFRISSDIIPFGSSEFNELSWWEIFNQQIKTIGKKVINNNIRVSMHPGQYTVLNSNDSRVVKNAIKDLEYHVKVLEALGVGQESKIILHIGGIYNDKKQAVKRFISNYQSLSKEVKERLVIENDDKLYNISDVLEIGKNLNIPVVFDNLHNKINPSSESKSDLYWINECRKTWQNKDGNQKIHYSQQNLLKRPGSHSDTINANEFVDYYENLEDKNIDIMLEVKDKNLSAVKCINCTNSKKNIRNLELEWSKYKYKVLENSPSNYNEIRKILRNKDDYPSMDFYSLIEEALVNDSSIGNSINAAQHIWGYFKDDATDKEKTAFLKKLDLYKEGKKSIKTIKSSLWKMATKYNQRYLLDSYYFIL